MRYRGKCASTMSLVPAKYSCAVILIPIFIRVEAILFQITKGCASNKRALACFWDIFNQAHYPVQNVEGTEVKTKLRAQLFLTKTQPLRDMKLENISSIVCSTR